MTNEMQISYHELMTIPNTIYEHKPTVIKQRKIIKYRGFVIKMVSYTKRSMEFLVIKPGTVPKRLSDVTSCVYSYPFMKHWIVYGKDAVDSLIKQIEDFKSNKVSKFLCYQNTRVAMLDRFSNEELLHVKIIRKTYNPEKRLKPFNKLEHTLYLKSINIY